MLTLEATVAVVLVGYMHHMQWMHDPTAITNALDMHPFCLEVSELRQLVCACHYLATHAYI